MSNSIEKTAIIIQNTAIVPTRQITKYGVVDLASIHSGQGVICGTVQQGLPFGPNHTSTGAGGSQYSVEVEDRNLFPQTVSIQPPSNFAGTSQKGGETSQSPATGICNMIKSEQLNLNGYSNTGSTLSSTTISIPGGGMAGLNNGAGDDGLGLGLSGNHDNWTSHDQQCCLVEAGRRCGRLAGNASYSKRIQKTVTQRKLKLHMDNSARHIYICDHHKELIQSLRTKRKRKDSEDDSGETDSEHPEVDLYQLQVNTLRRYKKHYKVPVRQGLNKAQLADCMMRHFKTIPVVEKEALTYFIYMVKTNKSKLDNRHGMDQNHRSIDSMDRD